VWGSRRPFDAGRFAILAVGLMFALSFGASKGLAQPHDNATAPAHDAAHGAHDAHGEHHAEDHGGHHEHLIYGKPPENAVGKGTEFLHVHPLLMAWTFVSFFIFWQLLKNFAWKPYLEAIHKREARVEEGMRKAEEAKELAKRLLEMHEQEMARAQLQAKESMDAARTQVSKDAEHLLAEARAKAEAARAAASAEIGAARQQAMHEIEATAAKLANGIASKLIERKLEGGVA
jgi:F-type H+-transporting ATPase subunit b